jgi:hypothetical protein
VGGAPGTWTVVGANTFPVGANYLVGLSATNSTVNTVSPATFDNRTVTPAPSGPALIAEDLNQGSPIGNSSDNSGTVTINAAGFLGDGGHFRYRQYVGDVTVTARAVSHTGSGFNTKAGVMIRDFSGDSAPYGMLGIAHYWGPYFVYRTVNAGGNSNNYGGASTYPQWTRMTRRGTKMTAWRANDAAGSPGTWTQRGAAQTFAAGAPVWVGLAADGDNSSSISNTAVLSGLTVTAGNSAPRCDAGPSGDCFSRTIPLSGSVTDDGPFTANWSKLSGPGVVTFANATAPNTTATWSAAGTYVLRLSANDGEVGSFADVTVNVIYGFEQWQQQSFPAGAENTGPNDDYDFDGLDNVMEFATGTSPTEPNANPATLDTVTIGADKFLRLTVPRDPSATNTEVEVIAGNDPADAANWTSHGLIIEQDTSTILQVRDNVPVGSTAARFLRLRVTHP